MGRGRRDAGPRPAGPSRECHRVTLDGVRWQEVFGGAALELMTRPHGGVVDSASLAERFWRETTEARRAALLPFLWQTIAIRGQIFGDSTRGSVARVTNGLRCSYPGYNELLAGAGDPRIASNDTVPNPNVTVLEWLNRLPPAAVGDGAGAGAIRRQDGPHRDHGPRPRRCSLTGVNLTRLNDSCYLLRFRRSINGTLARHCGISCAKGYMNRVCQFLLSWEKIS
jgi:hypothetical protein